MNKKVLVTDGIDEEAKKIMERSLEVVEKKGLSPEELKNIISGYNAIVIRSATKLTADIIEKADNMEIIGRAGIGVDNVDLEAATKKGIIVVNAPASNAVTVAEHTIALMMALVRKIPDANQSLKMGKWEKSRFKGIELEGKTLGIVGFGQIGGLVAKKALGLDMKVVAYDPFVSMERFKQLGIKKAANLEDIYAEADFISIHLPKNKDTLGMFDKEQFRRMKKGTYILNVARGGIIVENDLAEAIREGHIAGAALDVYEQEPCTGSPVLELEQVVCTPHLGASTAEAQNRAGTIIAGQVLSVLTGGTASFPVNAPAIRPELMEMLSPFFELCENMGSFFINLFEGNLDNLEIGYYGQVSEYDVRVLTSMILTKILGRYSAENVNMINADMVAKNAGLKVKVEKSSHSSDFVNLISIKGSGPEGELSVSGTVTGKKNKPRFLAIDKFEIDMVPSRHMAFIRYEDVPGQIGKIGSAFGRLNVNIASMHVGRKKMSGEAVMGLNLDTEVDGDMLKEFKKTSGFENIKVVNLY
ncbi:MAG: phosphoglycerate dehydrogenase [Actinobacteria bacterium]|nr:phosphoglycerate dehydrogenase [Actinomycetota bacterium]